MPDDIGAQFKPDYTPEQMESMGVYDALYRGQGPRLASLGEWKPEWISEHDPKGWAQWYKRYAAGRRIPDEDERQIKRWLSFKARHGGPFAKNPTPRRGWALRNWGIDPANLVPNEARNGVVELLDSYKNRKMQQYVKEKQAELLPEVNLQPHQERIQATVNEDSPRMIVYHGLGSGKSLSALAAAEAAKKKYDEDYGIVAPASLRGNFQKEVEKFTRGSKPEILSYTGLGLGKKFTRVPETVIMDEAHRIRNPGGAAAQAAADVANQAKRVLLLTGSPITNSPSDLANLISIVARKNISPQDFEKKYIGYKTVHPGLINWAMGIKPGVRPVVKNEGELRQLLQGHVDYQPSKTPEGVNVNEEKIEVPLTQAQQRIQKALRTKIPPSFLWKLDQEFPLSKDELSKLNSFLTGLRQNSVSTRPFRVDSDAFKAFQQSGKLQEAYKKLNELLESDPRKKAIIYSNHIGAGIEPYAAALAKYNIPHGIFHGGIPTKQRQKALADYNAGKLRALLIGPAGAEGLSTKGTNLIQLLDPHWHESRTQQARGRGLRFDSHDDLPEELKNVHVQRFISKSEDPSFLGKMLGYRRERTGDEILERLSNEKERINERFRELLREVGSQNHAKTAAFEFGEKMADQHGGLFGRAGYLNTLSRWYNPLTTQVVEDPTEKWLMRGGQAGLGTAALAGGSALGLAGAPVVAAGGTGLSATAGGAGTAAAGGAAAAAAPTLLGRAGSLATGAGKAVLGQIPWIAAYRGLDAAGSYIWPQQQQPSELETMLQELAKNPPPEQPAAGGSNLFTPGNLALGAAAVGIPAAAYYGYRNWRKKKNDEKTAALSPMAVYEQEMAKQHGSPAHHSWVEMTGKFEDDAEAGKHDFDDHEAQAALVAKHKASLKKQASFIPGLLTKLAPKALGFLGRGGATVGAKPLASRGADALRKEVAEFVARRRAGIPHPPAPPLPPPSATPPVTYRPVATILGSLLSGSLATSAARAGQNRTSVAEATSATTPPTVESPASPPNSWPPPSASSWAAPAALTAAAIGIPAAAYYAYSHSAPKKKEKEPQLKMAAAPDDAEELRHLKQRQTAYKKAPTWKKIIFGRDLLSKTPYLEDDMFETKSSALALPGNTEQLVAISKEASFRWYKRFPVNDNLALNMSFGGPSITVKKLIPGTSMTFGNRAPRLYVGTPIPGLAYQQYMSPKKHKIKAEKEFKDDPNDERTTFEKIKDFLFGSDYSPTAD